MRRRIEFVAFLDFFLHLIERLSANDWRMIVGDEVSWQLPGVLDDFMRPRVFREIPLQDDIADVNGILQNVSDEGHRAGMTVFLEPSGCASERNAF